MDDNTDPRRGWRRSAKAKAKDIADRADRVGGVVKDSADRLGTPGRSSNAL